MTKEEIKQEYSMRDILFKCGISQPNRAGFIQCPFHTGDRDPSMKIYAKDFHCFGCGEHGDIFIFLQKFYGISFKEAFAMLGGSYEKPTFSSNLAVYKAQQERKMREKKQEQLRKKRELNNTLIGMYRNWLGRLQPLSDGWCDCYNALQYQLYVHEILNEKRTGD